MNEKEIAEIRRRFKPEKSNITHIRGCYVNEQREIVSQFNQSLGLMAQEEADKFLAILKKTLSGTLGKNLLDVEFDNEQVLGGAEHKLLMDLRASALKEEEAVQAFFEKVIGALTLEGSYLILLAHDTYDVPFRSSDSMEPSEGASEEVYAYFLCSICPVKPTKPALSYYVHKNEFHNRPLDWVVSPPELGFTFPAFDERRANLYSALYYTKDASENHPEFAEAVFQTPLSMPAVQQKEIFASILGETLAEESCMEVVQAVQDELCEMIETHKENKEEAPLVISKEQVRDVLQSCGVGQERTEAFDKKFDDAFGTQKELHPRNLVNPKQTLVRTPSVTIQVGPDGSGLLETRVIDGRKYILIRAEEDVTVNGVPIRIS